MEKQNKGFKLLMRLMVVLFIIFLCLYTVSQNGYLRRINQNKTLYTEEMIKKFEEDVSAGNYIDIDEYLKDDTIDYSNRVSRFGEKFSSLICDGVNKGLELLSSFFSYLFN